MIEQLRKLISYDAVTGQFARLATLDPHGTSSNGCIRNDGYRKISVAGRNYTAHRLAWALHYGDWPSGQIDHINGNRDDNRIANIRLACNAENARNMVKKTGVSGYTGVSPNGKGWLAKIRVDGKQTCLGTYQTPEEAAEAYGKAEKMVNEDPDLLASYAETLAIANGKGLKGKPIQLIERALKLDPKHSHSLFLAGAAAMEAGENKKAIAYWETLLPAVEPGSEIDQMLRNGIEKMKEGK